MFFSLSPSILQLLIDSEWEYVEQVYRGKPRGWVRFHVEWKSPGPEIRRRSSHWPSITQHVVWALASSLWLSGLQTWLGRTRLKPASQNSIRVSHVGGRGTSTSAITCCSLRCTLIGSYNWQQIQDSYSGTPTWDMGVPVAFFVPYITIALSSMFKNVDIWTF